MRPDQAVAPNITRPPSRWKIENRRIEGSIRIAHILGHSRDSRFKVDPVGEATGRSPPVEPGKVCVRAGTNCEWETSSEICDSGDAPIFQRKSRNASFSECLRKTRWKRIDK